MRRGIAVLAGSVAELVLVLLLLLVLVLGMRGSKVHGPMRV